MPNVDLWKKAVSLRKNLGDDATSPIDLFALAYSIDRLSIVYYPMGERLSGICIKDKGSNVIAINSSMTLGRRRFAMAHELYHLYFDCEQLTAVCAIKIGEGSVRENKADQFASFFLMPPDALSDRISQIKKSPVAKFTVNDIVSIEQYFQISRKAVLCRLIGENELTEQDAEAMSRNVIMSAAKLGYDDSLYRPAPKEKQYGTYGHFILQAGEVQKRGLVSREKYEELLLSAYRPDLVHGYEPKAEEILD